jgi:peptide deformylase
MTDELEVLLYGSPVLRQACQPVTRFDDELRELVESMARTMIRENGIGLAAPQVGRDLRLIIAQPGQAHGPQVFSFANPEFVRKSTEQDDFTEGCLSLPDITADVRRPVGIKLRYQDLEGNERELEDEGLLARIIQHEADHLDGVLFVDHLSLLRRKLLAKKLKALAKRGRAG